jgi:N-glycosidase YbiA
MDYIKAKSKQTIQFYSVGQAYGEFSNFALYSIKLKGKIWQTSEHYFQAQKFAGTAQEEKIRLAKTPMLAAQMGRDRSQKLRKDWDNIKDNMMYEAVWAKFTQHPDLEQLLLATEDAILVEHTENDDYWGDGGDGSGSNKLGKILMKIREKLKNAYQ